MYKYATSQAWLRGARSTRIVDQWSRAVPPGGERALMSVPSEERKSILQDNSCELARIDGLEGGHVPESAGTKHALRSNVRYRLAYEAREL